MGELQYKNGNPNERVNVKQSSYKYNYYMTTG